jgi:hypothetical protein
MRASAHQGLIQRPGQMSILWSGGRLVEFKTIWFQACFVVMTTPAISFAGGGVG